MNLIQKKMCDVNVSTDASVEELRNVLGDLVVNGNINDIRKTIEEALSNNPSSELLKFINGCITFFGFEKEFDI